MLLNFSFRNHSSFRDEQQFSMMRSARGADARWPSPRVSTVAVAYGANASGKSNFLRAMHLVCELVRDSYGRSDGVALGEPFILDPQHPSEPSAYDVEFVADDGVRYVYSLAVRGAEVEHEELLAFLSSRASTVFVRDHGDGERPAVTFGSSVRGPKRQLAAMLTHGSLLLSLAAAAGFGPLLPAWRELADGVSLFDASAFRMELAGIKLWARRDPSATRDLSRLMAAAGLGVDALEVRSAGPAAPAEGLPAPGPADSDEAHWLRATDLFFRHPTPTGAVWLPSALESDGTLATLAFLSAAWGVLSRPGVMLVDEIERGLHPTLVRALVDLFADPESNPGQAQLVFTSHDATLLAHSASHPDVVDRDAVWLVEKGADGSSSLFPLTELSPRKGENMERNYLNGVYSAVPTLGLRRAVAELVREGRDDGEEGTGAGKAGRA